MGDPEHGGGALGTLKKLDSKWAGVNRYLSQSLVGRYFKVEERNSDFFTELKAGTVCFLTVAYIIPVNAAILSDTGGSCTAEKDCSAIGYEQAGFDCVFSDPEYASCVNAVRLDLISSTCIAACIATLLMAVFAKMPIAVAPAMGINAFFTYNVVGFRGTGFISYPQALAAVFIEGWIFIVLTVTGIRVKFLELIPPCILLATAAGIGAFLAFLGLQTDNGIGLVTFDSATLVTLGGCPVDQRQKMYTVDPSSITYENLCATANGDYGPPTGNNFWSGVNTLGPISPNTSCPGSELRAATLWLGFFSGVIAVVLMMKGINGGILAGIAFCTFISWIPGHEASYFKEASPIPGGQARYEYFLKGGTVPSTKKTGGKLDFTALSKGNTWAALITFLYLDFLDSTGTAFALAQLISQKVPGFMNAKGHWPRQMLTLLFDGVATVIGSLLGTSPLTIFAESAVGIRAGGVTGITALVVSLGFFVSMFLSPIFGSIPPYATGPALVLVGALMAERIRFIQWQDTRQAVPAFITILVMPLTYSIAYGLVAGIMTCTILWFFDTIWETVAVLSGYYKGAKTMRHVWLDAFSNWYCAFNREDILLRDLPGYVVQDHRDATLEDPSVGSVELKLTMANLGEEASGSSKDDSPTEPKGGPREVVK